MKKHLFKTITPLCLVLFISAFATQGNAEPIGRVGLAIRAIIGEASNQGYQGMLAVACGIRNRGHLRGVYGGKAPHIDKEPQWVWDMARRAWEESEHNRIHSASHWESINFSVPYWAKNMKIVYQYKDHIFYK